MWLTDLLLPVAILLAVLLVLWPTSRSGQRLLQTWGLRHPDDDQIREAVRYLRQRRVLYAVLFVGLPPLAELLGVEDARLPGLGIFGPVVVAMLVAELVAVWRPVGGVRSASLDRRSWRDLVPRWALAAAAVQVALVVLFAVAAQVPVADRLGGLAYAAACLVVVGLLVHLAVRRSAVADETVAAALRMRTARVAVGIGFGWLGAALTLITREDGTSWGTAAMFLLLGAVFAWIWIANGTLRVPARR